MTTAGGSGDAEKGFFEAESLKFGSSRGEGIVGKESQKSVSSIQPKETYYRGNRDLLQSKRDLLQRQKRHTTEAKETYYRGKRDLLQRQKRPTTEAKETYYTLLPLHISWQNYKKSEKAVY
jgi:hypothetical protein